MSENGAEVTPIAVTSEKSEAIEENRDRVPFRIRGHHLQQYSALVHGMPPEKVAKETLNSAKRTPFMSFWEKQSMLKDYRGLPGQGWSYVDRLTDVFKQFNELPDDFPIELAEEQRDRICDSCVIGRHCDLKKIYTEGDPYADKRFLDDYLEEARQRRYPVDVLTEMATFSDAPPEEMRIMRTSAGAVKDILRTTVGKFAK